MATVSDAKNNATLRAGRPSMNPNTRYRALCQHGEQLKDVLHWSWTERGNLKVTALAPLLTRSIRLQLGHLMRMMVMNFPQMVRRATHDGGARYVAESADPLLDHEGGAWGEARRHCCRRDEWQPSTHTSEAGTNDASTGG
jgi:hypothetical protein